MNFKLARRTLLKGMGASLALPALEAMLNSHGTAFAQGVAFPKRYVAWFFGNGVLQSQWNPAATGPNWALTPLLQPLVDASRGVDVRSYVSVVSGYNIKTPNLRGHHNGVCAMMSGAPFIPLDPMGAGYSSKFSVKSVDQVIADAIAGPTPHKSLQIAISKRYTTGEGSRLCNSGGTDGQGSASNALLWKYEVTGDKKYLEPLPKALAYFNKCVLPDGKVARFYEFKTNKPLYMNARYELTYDDSAGPGHYGWKQSANFKQIEQDYEAAKKGAAVVAKPRTAKELEADVRRIVKELDAEGRWVSVYAGERLVGQPKFALDFKYISSAVFSRNVEVLSEYLAATKK